MAIDYEAEGLLDGVEDERAREARLDLFRSLTADGVPLEELKCAVAEGRLALLPVERVIAPEGERYTEAESPSGSGSTPRSSSAPAGRWGCRRPIRESAS